jgi:hypothetical protein
MLARADESGILTDWRAAAFAVLAPGTAMPAIAPLALRSAGIAPPAGSPAPGSPSPEAAWVCMATPVHYLAELSNVRFAGDGILTLDADEACALARDFTVLWRGAGVHLWAVASRLFCAFDAPLEVITQDPEAARGRHLQSLLPAGRDAARLRRLMSEMEMWLFDHAVNHRRKERSHLPISGLWLWGGGAPLDCLPVVHGGAAGEDVLCDAYPAGSERPGRERLADVMVIQAVPGSQAWSGLESHWLEPTLADLRRGRLERLDLSAGEKRHSLSARWRRRFWRRARPWWEYFEP